MIGIYCLILASLLYLSGFIANKKIKYTLVLLFFTLSFISLQTFGIELANKSHSLALDLISKYSLSLILYSFFSAPSYLCTLLSLYVIFKILVRDFTPNKYANILKYKINPLCFIVFVIFGLILFLGNLNLFIFDIYHANAINIAIFVFIFIASLYFIDRFCAILALIALFFSLDSNILVGLMCIYLWLFSVFYIFIKGFIFIKGKICKE